MKELAASDDPAAARRQFGNATLHLEDARDEWRWARLDAWSPGFRYALRVVRRKPVFAITVAQVPIATLSAKMVEPP